MITSDLSEYWARTNDLSLACLRYFQDLNNKVELGFNPVEINEIVTTVIMKCHTKFGLTNANTMRIYGEFIYYAVFGGKLPGSVRNKKLLITMYLDTLESYIIDNPFFWNKKITKVIDRKTFIY